jgi:hypothetical protein
LNNTSKEKSHISWLQELHSLQRLLNIGDLVFEAQRALLRALFHELVFSGFARQSVVLVDEAHHRESETYEIISEKLCSVFSTSARVVT